MWSDICCSMPICLWKLFDRIKFLGHLQVIWNLAQTVEKYFIVIKWPFWLRRGRCLGRICFQGSVCAITASEKLSDTVWFVQIKSKEETSDETVIDDYRNKIIPSQSCFIANYIEKVLTKKWSQSCKEMAKLAFIYKMSIVYPFVKYQNEKWLYVIRNNELCEIIAFVEQDGLI